MRLGLIAVVALLFAGIVFAGCSTDAYTSACKDCKFDANGKMDQPCYQAKQAGGTACLSSRYPMAFAQYSAGKCGGIQTCIDALQSCKSSASGGSDKADCEKSSVLGCFAAADTCVQQESQKCSQPFSICGGPGLIMLIGGFVFLTGYVKKE
jgi:hypothetical protein